MISTRPRILIKVTFLKHFALEVWVSIYDLKRKGKSPRKNGVLQGFELRTLSTIAGHLLHSAIYRILFKTKLI